jgi:membrane AbrB-like protein
LGYVIGRFSRFPGGAIVTAMICSAVIHATGITQAAPPRWLVIFAQILIGSVAGARFAGLTWAELKTTVAIAVVWAVCLLATGAGIAALTARLIGTDLVSTILAFAPGGTAEMIIVTYALGGDVAFVATFQLLRIFLVLTFVPVLFHALIVPTPKLAGGSDLNSSR